MDDATRKQVIEALEDAKQRLHTGWPMIPLIDEALTALKAIQPRPDVVVAARRVVRVWQDILDPDGYARFSHDAPVMQAIEAALADEQEWEVRWKARWPSGILSGLDTATKEDATGYFCDGIVKPEIVPVYIPKAEPQPVSREKAIDEAAREIMTLLGFAQEPSREPGADRLRDKVRAIVEGAALSREVQP